MASVESYLKTGTFHFPTPSPVRVTSCPLGPAQPQGESCLLLVPSVNRPSVFLKPNSGQTSIEDGGPIQKNVESSPELFFFSSSSLISSQLVLKFTCTECCLK